MKKNKLFFKLNNKGESLVLVIIVIAFIGLLAGTVMMTSLVNYKMKRVNVYAKDTFYSAEQVLDEINIGLQRYISDSMSTAYVEVMENYSDYSIQKKRMVLQTNYYESMWNKLQVAGNNQYYNVAVLESFLKPSTRWQGADDTGYGAIVRAVDASGSLSTTGVMHTYENGIVLKDLKIYYKDSKGYVSVIQTDIRLTYPEMDFAQTTALPDVASYGVIADAGLETVGPNSLDLEGNFYVDSFTSESNNVHGKKQITHAGDGDIIVKHDLLLKNASFSNEQKGTVWAENIETVGANITFIGQTNVADDLNIKGDQSVITLSGTYNGFGNSIKDAQKSSAILINGTNTSIDLAGIEKITLAGHAYIGTKHTAVDGEGNPVNGNDIYTGESIAVKSNQLMYMVPAECVGVDVGTGESLYNKNPLTTEEYQTIKNNPEQYIEVSTDVKVTKLDSTLKDYIAQVNGIAQPEVVFVPTSDTPLVYYYMKFDSEDAANRYFNHYYSANKETYDRYIKSYVELIQFPTTANVTRIKMAAGGVYGEDASGYFILPHTVDGAATQLADNQVQYQERFEALSTKLTEDFAQLTNLNEVWTPENQIVFENVINKTELHNYVASGGGSSLEINGAQGTVILSEEPTVTIGETDVDVHLVIATGDVEIKVPDFVGTVFTDGKVTVAESVRSIKADYSLVSSLLYYYKEIGGQNVMVAQVLQDANDYVFVMEDAEDTQRTTNRMADLIVYENWKKE